MSVLAMPTMGLSTKRGDSDRLLGDEALSLLCSVIVAEGDAPFNMELLLVVRITLDGVDGLRADGGSGEGCRGSDAKADRAGNRIPARDEGEVVSGVVGPLRS